MYYNYIEKSTKHWPVTNMKNLLQEIYRIFEIHIV